MSEFKVSESSNEWTDWFKDATDKEYIKYYEYEHFSNISEIGSGNFGKVYRANWKNSNKYFALKSFFNLSNSTAKEIVNEVIYEIMIFSFFCVYRQ